jgi:hypothetical protein
MPPRPRRTGVWLIQWLLDGEVLATLKIKVISKKQFLRSLRISATRFVVQFLTGEVQLIRNLPPLDGVRRVAPCFLIGSGEPGLAGLATLRVLAKTGSSLTAPLLHESEMLVSDGPMPLCADMLDVSELAHIKHFSLDSPAGTIGILPLTPVPSATFTTEGGFRPVEDFVWSPAAEEQLNESLSRLLGGS